MVLSDKFEQALRYAAHVHAGQNQKGTTIPYMAHLLGTASIVLEYGGTEDEAIAALLHDAAEDAGGAGRLEDIRARFGECIADLVEGCTDTMQRPKPAWRARKAGYIARVPKLSASARLVSAADKLNNTRAMLRELRQCGDEVWKRFKGGREGTLWYYRCLVQAFRTAGATAIVDELDRTVAEIEKFVANEKQTSPTIW